MNLGKRFRIASHGLTAPVQPVLAAMGACCLAFSVLANPANPVVVSGSATFSQTGSTLTVTNSNGAIINWGTFSIKAGETTHFAQTSASSSVLNRVLNDPTAIYGTLSSNGKVWLINPAGIMIGPGARVDTAGFVASSLNIRNEDFLAGRKLFENTPGAGNVVNQGEIRTPSGGSVYLIGSNVSNEGIIVTPQGETILAAGATVSLIDSATPGVKVDITGAAGNATNLGEITAEAGRVGIAGVIVRNSGLINASSVVSEGGRVFLKASQAVLVEGGARILAGTQDGGIEFSGNDVSVGAGASIGATAIQKIDSDSLPSPSLLLPGNPVVASGSVSFSQSGSTLTVTNSNSAVINWGTFTIRAGETTNFTQSSASSLVLNRVLNDPKAIYGTLSSGGRVWLINRAGILVGPGSRVDTGAFVANGVEQYNAGFHAARLQPILDLTFGNVFRHTGNSMPVGGGVRLVGSGTGPLVSGGTTMVGRPLSLIDSATPGIKVDIAAIKGGSNDIDRITAAARRFGIAGVLTMNPGRFGAGFRR